MKNTETQLFYFDDRIPTRKNLSKTNGFSLEFKNFKKFDEIPKYSWEIACYDSKLLLLSEEKNQIYNYNLKKKDSKRNVI